MNNVSGALIQDYFFKAWEVLNNYAATPTRKLNKKEMSRLPQLLFETLMSRRFRKQHPDDPENVMAAIENAIANQTPIDATLTYGPLKNPNNSPYQAVDLAEFYAMVQLARQATAIKEIYEPGLQVTIQVDDSRAEYANQACPVRMASYFDSLRNWVAQAPLNALIKSVVPFSQLYPQYDHASHLEAANLQILRWKSAPENQSKLLMYYERARRNLYFDQSMSLDEREEFIRDAVHRYMVCYEAEKLCGIWSQPNTLYMHYTNHPGVYQIYTFRKESVSQPWQGQGGLMLTQQGKLDAYLLTCTKQNGSKYAEIGQYKTGLTLPFMEEVRLVSETPVAAPLLVAAV